MICKLRSQLRWTALLAAFFLCLSAARANIEPAVPANALAFPLRAAEAGIEKTFTVLYINSYHRGYGWSDSIEAALRAGLERAPGKVELSVEYLDSRRFDQQIRKEEWALAMQKKYADYPLDIIITSDNAALDFALAHREKLFKDVPMVFCGYNFFRPSILDGISGVTGVNEEIRLNGTIELALAIQPATRVLVFVVSTGDVSSLRILETAETDVFPHYRKRYQVVLLKDASIAEIQNRLLQLPAETVVFIAGQTSDRGDGRALTPEENSRSIAALSPFPVYGFWEFNLNTGVLGGQILTGADQGKAAAEMAVKILKGTPPAEIPVRMQAPTSAIFDYTVMQRLGLRERQLPPRGIVINRPVSLWTAYRRPIIGAFLLLLLSVVLIWNRSLRRQIARRKQVEAQLQQTGERLSSILASMDDLVFVLDADGRFVDSQQQSHARLLLLPEQFLGKHYRQVMPPDVADLTDQAIAAARQDGAQQYEYRLDMADGEHWYSANLSARHTTAGVFDGSTTVVRDITEHKRLEETLRSNQAMLRAVIDFSPVPLALNDEHGNITFLNPAFVQTFGYDLNDIPKLADWWPKAYPDPAYRQWVADTWQATLEQCERTHTAFPALELNICCKNGAQKTVLVSAAAISHSQTFNDLHLVVLYDITERKLAVAELREAVKQREAAEQFARETIDALSAHLCVLDEYGNVMMVNRAWREFGEKNHLHMPCAGVSYLDVADTAQENGDAPGEEFAQQLKRVFKGEIQAFQHEYPCHSPVEKRWFVAHVTRFSSEPLRVVVAHESITTRKLAEEALLESEKLHRASTDTSPLAVCMSSGIDQRTEYMNPTFTKLFGYTMDEVPSVAAWWPLAYPDEAYRNQVSEEWQRRAAIAIETRSAIEPMDVVVACKNGSKRNITWSFVSSGDQNWVFGLDYTERKQAETELIKAREAADTANHAKSAFLANMSHELRTPLNAVLGFAQILQQSPALPPAHRPQVDSILRGGQYLLTLINDILDLAKVEAGHIEFCPEKIEVAGFFRDIEFMFLQRAESKGIRFEYQIDAPFPRTIQADPTRLRQVLVNLLGNAVKFTEQGGVRLQAAYRDGCLHLGVRDSGPGIDPAQHEEIFKPFSQTGDHRYRAQGTGLGLAITRKIVVLMGGAISLDSGLGRGSCFQVTVPLAADFAARAEIAPPPRGEMTGYVRTDSPNPFKILLVDDVADNRAILHQLLQPLGFENAEADGGEAALQRAPQFQPDLVLMDLRMPGLDGLETTRRLRALPGFDKLPVIAVSAGAYQEDWDAARSAGCVDYLVKPVDRRVLLQALQTYLNLEWLYAAGAEQSPTPSGPPLTGGQREKIAHFIKRGDILGLNDYLTALAAQPDCPADGAKLLALAQSFQLNEIRRYLERQA